MKFKAIYFVIFIISFNLICSNLVCSCDEIGNGNKVIFIYNEEKTKSNIDGFIFLKESIKNYDCDCEYIEIKKIDNKHINDYSHIIVWNIEKNIEDTKVLDKLKEFKGNVYWIGDGIDKFSSGQNNLQFERQSIFANKIVCNNKSKDSFYIHSEFNESLFIKDTDENNNLNELRYSKQINTDVSTFKNNNQNNDFKTYGWITDGSRNYNYLVKNKNLWYLPCIPKEKKLKYVVLNSLNDFINVEREEKAKIYIFLDVDNNDKKSVNLKKIKDYLKSENIPFMISSDKYKKYISKELEDFPYSIKDTVNNTSIICADLVDFNSQDKMYIKKLEENYRELALVDGFDATLNIKATDDIELIKEIINFLKSKNVDFKKFDKSNKEYFKNKENLSKSDQKENKEEYILQINNVFVFLIGAFCIIFTIIFFKYRRINKNKFFK